ncbi:MAG: hypothetical protein A3H42_04910, partial [Deltaproteobacteria bacterium RIFCSPLOWO2_02_FULL_46_8]
MFHLFLFLRVYPKTPRLESQMIWILFFFGLLAGFVDAIAGGGGLIMIPGMLFSGLPVSSAIATNKFCGTVGALTSSLKYMHGKNIDWRAAFVMGAPAMIGAVAGSQVMPHLPKRWAEPVVIFLLLAITLFILFKPELGVHNPHHRVKKFEKHQLAKLFLFGLLIGFHDGFFGPGTGTFFVFVLVAVGSLNFLKGTGTAKVLNFL